MYALWIYTDGEYQLLKQRKAIDLKNANTLREIERLRKDSSFIDSSFHSFRILCEMESGKLKQNISTLTFKLDSNSTRLKLSDQKISELEAMLFRRDSIMQVIRRKLTDALFAFKDQGVNVHVVGGKVYISLDEKLLFKSGQVEVNADGRNALLEITYVLNIDTTTNITIEGHTDDMPFKSATKLYKDNWDISVLRATSVVRFMQLEGKVSPLRIIASGRAEYYPIDPSKTFEARKKNRRIEIIVTPDLDEIARLLSN
jgi:chemotaxis protein MotB